MGERNNGQWTNARYQSFIKGGLRGISRRWPPKYECLAEAYVGQQINVRSGRLAKHYECAGCGGRFAAAGVQVDHIHPVVDPAVGFVDWNTIIERMFCEKEFLQVLCKVCHDDKTKAERELAKLRKNKNNE